ncbi:MAG: hypothetical protein ABFD66_08670 [Smithella sp.]
MPQIYEGLEAARLKFPEPILKIDWDQAININEGKVETVKLLKVCKLQAETLRACRGWPAVPETLTWITLWTRNLNLLQATIAILESQVGIAEAGQAFALRILWRPAFELWVILSFIYKEKFRFIPEHGVEQQTLAYRMCAYLAWCLWNDKERAHKMTESQRLDTLFGSGKMPKQEEIQLVNQGLKFLWGDDQAADPADDRETKRLVRTTSLDERNQLLRWLQHEKLCKFEDKIRKERPSNYFELVAPQNRSLCSLLRSSWIGAGYPAYQEASSLIHGSTFVQHMKVIDNDIFPNIASTDVVVQRQAGHVRRYCHFNVRILQCIQKRMEQEGLTKPVVDYRKSTV